MFRSINIIAVSTISLGFYPVALRSRCDRITVHCNSSMDKHGMPAKHLHGDAEARGKPSPAWCRDKVLTRSESKPLGPLLLK
jgi:hypothetical protein